MTHSYDVAVIGGGVIGLSCALELSRRGRSVVLLERDEPGAHASRVAAGLLGTAALPVGEQAELLPLKRDSLSRCTQFVAEIEAIGGADAGYRDEGTLWIARDRAALMQLEALHAYLADHGLRSTLVTSGDAQAMEPSLADGVVGGLAIDDDVQIDPRKLIAALVAACEASGVTIRSGCEVQRGARDGSAWRLSAGAETVVAEQVVVTAGAWCDEIRAADDGESLAAVGVGPVKGQLLRMRGPRLVERVVRTDGVTVAQRRHGELIVASTKEPEAGWDLTATDDAREILLARATQLIPDVARCEIVEHSVGLRPAFGDRLPLIGAVGEGVFVASGHYQHGILLAPATAHWLADVVEGGSVPELIAPFARRQAGVQITVNGELVPLIRHSLPAALAEMGYDPEQPGIAVALNMSVVPRSEWAETQLADGDRIDIVGARQGG